MSGSVRHVIHSKLGNGGTGGPDPPFTGSQSVTGSQSSSSLEGSSSAPTSATGSQLPVSLTGSGGSTTIPTTIRSQKSVPSTARKALPAGAIVKIVIGVFSFLSLGILLVWLGRRRYRRRQSFTSPIIVPSPASVTSSSSNGDASDDSDAVNISTVRQQCLQNELRAAQERIVDTEDVEGHADHTRTTRGSFPESQGSILRLLSTRSTTTTQSGSTDHDLSLRERNEMLRARIRELEEQLRSPWALGLSDEPPPGYSEEQA
ncbi:hypothetical protein B0H11DRAFT_2283646 [Mycena galericulata]|nr:hypothetical protein B0H11DRAFT_2283646 [Mycena galericulata]